jgi:hypothetical protein
MLICSCDIKMGAFCFIPLLKAVGFLGIGLISRRCFGGVYVSISSLVHEAEGSGSLDLYNVDVESCTSVSTLGVTELIAMEKK